MAPVDSEPTSGAARFSLRSLLVTVTASCVFLAVCVWNTAIGIPLSLAVLGVFLAVTGIRTGRRGAVILGGILVVAAVGLVAFNPPTVVAWVGRHKLDVHVFVVDASSLTPLSNATVEVLHGPYSPLEGPPPNVDRDFEIIESGQSGERLTTDERGYTTFTHEFFAAGTDGLFTNSGYVDTRRVWLRITAPGYRTTFMPVDGQSARARDIDDESPIFVTIPVGKE